MMEGTEGEQSGRKTKGTLAVASIFRNATFYLKEWIEYHLMLGVERFHLCDNRSVDGPIEILEPYIDRGVVVLVRSDADHGRAFATRLQAEFFTAVCRALRGHSEWVAFIDPDEFLTPSHVTDSTLADALARHKHAAGVGVNRLVYGASGVRRKPRDDLVIETFTRRNDDDRYWENHRVKLIVRPEHIDRFYGPHAARTIAGAPGAIVTADGTSLAARGVTDHLDYSDFTINHYAVGDLQHFERYRATAYRGWTLPVADHERILARARDDTCSRVTDTRWHDRYGADLRKRMGMSPAVACDAVGCVMPAQPQVCVLVHLIDPDGWDSCASYLANVHRAGIVYDLYATVARSKWTPALDRALASFHDHACVCLNPRGHIDGDAGGTRVQDGSRCKPRLPVQVVLLQDDNDIAQSDTATWMLGMHRIINECRRSYDYILNVPIRKGGADVGTDTASGDWDKQAWSALMGSPQRVLECMAQVGTMVNIPGRSGTGQEASLVAMVGHTPRMGMSASIPNEAKTAAKRYGLDALVESTVVRGNLFWAHLGALTDSLACVDLLKCARSQAQLGSTVDGTGSAVMTRAISLDALLGSIIARAKGEPGVRGMDSVTSPILGASFHDEADGTVMCQAHAPRDWVARTCAVCPSWLPNDVEPFTWRRGTAERGGSDPYGPHLSFVCERAQECTRTLEIGTDITSVTWALAEGMSLARLRNTVGAHLTLATAAPTGESHTLVDLAGLVGVTCTLTSSIDASVQDGTSATDYAPVDMFVVHSRAYPTHSALLAAIAHRQDYVHRSIVIIDESQSFGSLDRIVQEFVQRYRASWRLASTTRGTTALAWLERATGHVVRCCAAQ